MGKWSSSTCICVIRCMKYAVMDVPEFRQQIVCMLYNSWSNYFTTKNAKYTWTCIYHQAGSWFNLLLTCIVYMYLPSHCYTILSHQWKRDNIMYNNLTVKKWAFPELYVQHSVHNYVHSTHPIFISRLSWQFIYSDAKCKWQGLLSWCIFIAKMYITNDKLKWKKQNKTMCCFIWQ